MIKTEKNTRTRQKKYALIDADALRHELTALYNDQRGNDTALRARLLDHLKSLIARAHELAEDKLKQDGKGTACATALARFQDDLIRVLYDFTITHVYRAKNPSAAERIAVVAVGGYGRGTLAPGSDIDLLFLLPYKQTAWSESVIEYMLYVLWDLGFKVGHATRSVEECIRLAQQDITIRTSVLEARFVWGDQALFDELHLSFDKNVLSRTAREFIEAKLEERDQRHKHFGATRYLVEPNIKDGKGGQRDLHTLFWIGKYIYRVQTVKELVAAGVFTKREYRRFTKCQDFQWAVRCHLHFMTTSSNDRITFEHQKELAIRLGYTSHGGLKNVERFMKHYFLIAKEVGDLTRIFCAVLEARAVKKAPVMNRLLQSLRRGNAAEIAKSGAFAVDGGRVTVTSDNAFKSDPVNLIRLFYFADKYNFAIHPDALKLITRSLRLIKKPLRTNPQANQLFLDILTSKNNPETTLRKMNEAGVLGRFVPDFGRIVALMQFNMYHHFTVDEHLLKAIGNLSEIERGEVAEEHPLCNEIIHKIANRRALYVAVFLHDIAKGRREDHSIAGARIARKLGPRFGLGAAETELCAWLVEHHLIMSDIAQRRDLTDQKTIRDFVDIAQTSERLKLLLVLTVADIKAVGPGVWNGWKGELLRTLYEETENMLSGGHSALSRAERAQQAMQAFRDRMEDWPAPRIDAYLERHSPAYWRSVDLGQQVKHAALLTDDTGNPAFKTAIVCDDFADITEITIYADQAERLLTLVTGACAALGANIADAQIFTTKDGAALDIFNVQRAFPAQFDERRRAEQIIANVEQGLEGDIRLGERIAKRSQPTARMEAFSVEPEVIIDNDRSEVFTVIEVEGRDRPGLLYDLVRAFLALKINISSAHIATFGERAVDAFYVTGSNGRKITSAVRHKTITAHMIKALAPQTKASRKPKSGKPASTKVPA